MGKSVLLIILLMSIFIFLYNSGYMVFKSIRAVSFIGSKRGRSATFVSCSGYMKRIVRFNSDTIYTFILDAELSKGDISVELHDSKKNRIMQLNCANQSASIALEKNKKYYLVFNFVSATGRYTLIRE